MKGVKDRMAENCERMSEWHRSSSQINTLDNDKLVRPKEKLHILLQQAGADKDVFTMKEVIFYLGQYIMKKQLYDMKQQHIVHCADDPLGAVLGVDSFSVKEPRVLFAMITQNLLAVKNQESQSVFTEPRSQSEPDRGPKETDSDCHSSSTSERRRRRSDPDGTSSTQEEDGCESRKRHRSDSFSLTFDDSMSWCVIGGLRRDRRSSESSDSHSNTEVGSLVSDVCDDVLSQDLDSDSDNFSVEFEVESIDSDAYSDPEEASVSGEDEVYEVTIFEAEEEDSFDDDTEITEADYWKCSKCEELNPPLPRNCNRCWTLRMDWFPESDSNSATTTLKPLPPKPSPAPTEPDETEGLDVPDGKRAKSPLPLLKDSQDLVSVSGPDSQDSACSSQPSTSSSNSNGVGSGSSSSAPFSQEVMVPDLERFNSLEAHLPASCLEPCVICQTRPKNGCIVHGRTGHLMACYTCARKLKKRNKLCPVCREPIQSVVLIYLS
ncbi:E3 ubiquitin-protein ligase Mdm2-like isoform X1 [Salmo trutta]|uniref:E3 ubiquitin-protein ligase Mdm2 n=2 Tax=Salmo trutta TaxID=8032 RepID=A0A674A1P1_SALTR|nr:E3 ubiquitin-protein ligase Mdm2-like isoform X1 [Salmo trutta]XP_029600136.1 E3 ubiquitin-protein ligase Mdm2-like isoform X1 [Salmo trutta]